MNHQQEWQFWYNSQKMEENTQIASKKNADSQHTEKQRISPQGKIQQLHDLIQGYFYHNNSKTLQIILPQFSNIRQQLTNLESQRQLLQSQKPTQSQMSAYYEIKKSLTQKVQILSKQVQSTRQRTKTLKIQRKQLEQQYAKNQQLLKLLKAKVEKMKETGSRCRNKENRENLRLPTVGRMSNVNLGHQRKQFARFSRLDGSIVSFTSSRSSQRLRQSKQCFFNTINFRRLKQIQRMLDQITTQSSSYRLEKLLVGDNRESIKNRVFKNFSIDQFFDNFLKQKSVVKQLLKIQKL